MDEQPNQEEERPAARGDAAWKAATEQIAARNQSARKAGKAEREAFERERADSRRASEARRHADLIAKHREKRP